MVREGKGMDNASKYYVGLDIGTDSVGWAVTDENYNIIRKKGKSLWGIRLFEAASPAAERRVFRSSRRRLQRKVQRIKWLQELFAEVISDKDPGFYQRMQDSKYYVEDKSEQQKNTLFFDSDYTDKEFHKEFPTIFHLRKALIEGKREYDIRLFYLAIHHILKHRGHFLFEGSNIESVASFENVYFDLKQYLLDEFEVEIETQDIQAVENLLKSKKIARSVKKKELVKLFAVEKENKSLIAILGLIAGCTEKISTIFANDDYAELEKNSICFSDAGYEQMVDDLEANLGENMFLIEKLKAIYDWAVLSEILGSERYLSFAKVAKYKEHEDDLIKLKEMIKKYCPAKYDEVFKVSDKSICNYPSYIGMTIKNRKKQYIEKKCSQEDFNKYVLNILSKYEIDGEYQGIMEKLSLSMLLPKQIVKDNGVIPYQVHKTELAKILENAQKNYPVLGAKGNDGLSIADKVLKIFEFRIPYYVGPLNDAHLGTGNCWIVKNKQEKIYPWNFEDVVDIELSAEKFITRMTNKCTYIIGADVIPKNSLLYSEFMVLNELNNVRIGQDKISQDIKIKIYKDLFLKQRKVTRKQFTNYLVREGIMDKKEEVSGFDGDFKASMSSYIDFSTKVGLDLSKYSTVEMVEEIIKWILLYGEDKKILINKIKKVYGNQLSQDQITQIKKLKYSSWGNFSRELLVDVVGADKETGECQSIIQALRDTTYNFMQLLSSNFTYSDEIAELNRSEKTTGKITYDIVKDLYVSPAVKHQLWQTVLIMDELYKVMGAEPEKIFIEMARGAEEKPTRKESRKNQLIELYKACKNEERDWVNELSNCTEQDFRRDRLYLYYTQKGRCMYSGKRIELADLFDANKYDVDHIYPQSKVKDDSLDNRVLVCRTYNANKTDAYPIDSSIQSNQYPYWTMLFKQNFISERKYKRLIRNTPFTVGELSDFIARQLVETRQSTKAAAELFKQQFDKTAVVYVKAGNVSEFRRQFDLVKVRDVNDYHHAKDAFLNIVVGNVYHTKFTSSPLNFFQQKVPQTYNIRRMYDFKVERNGKVAWIAENGQSITHVKKVMRKNDILYTRASFEAKGGLFNQTLASKETCKVGSGYIPLKGSDSRMKDITKYGGYGNIAGAYFFLVEHDEKKKRVRTIEFVPLYLKASIEASQDGLLSYCTDQLKLVNPVIVEKKIKMQSLLKINGFYYHITGRSENRLLVRSAVQLCIDEDVYNYSKKIYKYLDRNKEAKKILLINQFDSISKEENMKLYDTLSYKLTKTIYINQKNSQGTKLIEARELFHNLCIEEQCIVLGQLFQLTKCANLGADLKLIGGSSASGKMLIGKNFSLLDEVLIIHQSITGLYERKINLLREV